MAIQQRIIGGGLLLAGIAVVLILIFKVHFSGVPEQEAYDRFLNEIHPEYARVQGAVEAGEREAYLELKRIAEEAQALAADTAMASVRKRIDADAARGDPKALALQKLLQGEAFKHNADGLYELEGEWYDDTTHYHLQQLKRSLLVEAVPALADARKVAKAAAEVVDGLRLGSGLELATAEPAPEESPVVAADAGLFRVLGIAPSEVAKALATKGAGAKANSTRLVWNGTDDAARQPLNARARARLAEDLARLPRHAEVVERAVAKLGLSETNLKGRDKAKKPAEEYVRQAARHLALVLDPAARQAVEAQASLGAVAEILKREAKLLKGHAANAPGLGTALAGNFVAE
jgi:hypothetical protein